MESVFDAAASGYLVEDEHWGSDLDIIRYALNGFGGFYPHAVTYADIGCGPGFHITAIKRWYPGVSVTGIDSSRCMLKQARKELRRFGLARKVELINADVRGPTIGGEVYKVVSFLNNGLGNLHAGEDRTPASVREAMVKKIRGMVDSDGSFIVSVYNRQKLKGSYGRNIRIMQKSDRKHGELFLEYRSKDGKVAEYYSHWFTEKELVDLLERNGFKIETIEKRMVRLVVLARLAESTKAT